MWRSDHLAHCIHPPFGMKIRKYILSSAAIVSSCYSVSSYCQQLNRSPRRHRPSPLLYLQNPVIYDKYGKKSTTTIDTYIPYSERPAQNATAAICKLYTVSGTSKCTEIDRVWWSLPICSLLLCLQTRNLIQKSAS